MILDLHYIKKCIHKYCKLADITCILYNYSAAIDYCRMSSLFDTAI